MAGLWCVKLKMAPNKGPFSYPKTACFRAFWAPIGFEPMTPAVASIVNFDLPKVVPGLCWCGRRATMDATEEAAVVIQFNEFLMSRLHSSTV